jgi:glycosyltransferase involved in cell wall biosynthesis
LQQRPRIFLSSTFWEFGLHNGPYFIPGRRHYSYEIARRKFEVAFRLLGLEMRDIPWPRIYAGISRRLLAGDCCHLIFKPAELIRIVKGIRNIACVVWEFDKLVRPDTLRVPRPFQNMRRRLLLPDEIWVPCEFTRRVFRDNGIRHVHRIPAPILMPCAAHWPYFGGIPSEVDKIVWVNLRLGPGRYRAISRRSPRPPSQLSGIIRDCYRGRRPDIFLSIVNPHDLRKNLASLIGGFLQYHDEQPNSLLLLKLVVDNATDRLDTVRTKALPPQLSEYELVDTNAVWLTTAYLPQSTLNDLYRVASAYLCTSLAEGQNLPLQEAMSFGLVPISTCHTAMADYISEDNAVIIRSTKRPIDRPDTAMGRTPGATWHVCTSADVAHALRTFAGLAEADRRDLGSGARAVITRDFSIETVAGLIQERLLQRGA